MSTRFLLTVASASLLLALGAAPLQAQSIASTTTCNDGTTSTASGKGACSSHGGVQKADAASAATAAPAPPAGATAKCKDGTFSMAKTHQGACSSHGGVGEWLDKK